MPVIRNPNRPVLISLEALRDPRLSLKAKGLLCYCLSFGEGYMFHVVNDLYRNFVEGETSVKKSIEALIQYGYCVFLRFGMRSCYLFFDTPQNDEDKALLYGKFRATIKINPKITVTKG